MTLHNLIAQKKLGVTWDVDLFGELLKFAGGKERQLQSKEETSAEEEHNGCQACQRNDAEDP